jgi:hypothetical protein
MARFCCVVVVNYSQATSPCLTVTGRFFGKNTQALRFNADPKNPYLLGLDKLEINKLEFIWLYLSRA